MFNKTTLAKLEFVLLMIEDINTILPNLRSLFSRFDLIESFSRISNALKLLHKQGVVPNK